MDGARHRDAGPKASRSGPTWRSGRAGTLCAVVSEQSCSWVSLVGGVTMIVSNRKMPFISTVLVTLGMASSLSACVVVQAPGEAPEASPVAVSAPPGLEESPPLPPPSDSPVTSVQTDEPVAEWSDTIDEARTGVVHLQVTRCDMWGAGSGFVIDDDLVVTAAHVVKDAADILLRIDDQLVSGEVLGTNDLSDIALVRTDTDVDGYHFEFIEGEPRIGTEVRALGFPLNLSVEDAEGSRNGFAANPGDVTALNQTVEYGFGTIENMIRTDASINEGNSGGPLITKDGSVVGLVSGVKMTTEDGTPVDGWAYAVTAPRIVSAITEWRERGTSVGLASCANAPAPDDATLQVNVVSSHDQATSIAQSLAAHGQAINIGNYDSAYSIFTGRALDKVGSLATWSEGVATSYWLGLRLDDVQGTGEQLQARVKLATAQDPDQHSPRGTTGQACSVWTLDYTMTWNGTRWLMENVQSVGIPEDCTDETNG